MVPMQMATDQTLVTNYNRLYSARLCREGSGPAQNNNTAMDSSAGKFVRAAAKLAFVYVCNE